MGVRQRQVADWMQDLEPIRDAIHLLLSLARGSADARRVSAGDGFFQDSLDSQAPVQMVRVELDHALDLYPEISGHKHRFNIRFMQASDTERPSQTKQDVDFRLTCCVF